MPAPSGDFSFFPNWGIESRILLSYKPFSLSHHPRDVDHFLPPGPLPQIEGTSLVERRERERKRDGVLTCMNLLMTKMAKIASKYQVSGG